MDGARANGTDVPSNAALCIWPLVLALLIVEEWVLLGEVQRLTPINDFAVGVMGVFGTERRPADEAFEHDGSNRPPITGK